MRSSGTPQTVRRGCTAVHPLRTVWGVPDDLINEVTQVEHEPQTILLGGTLVFENHSPISVLCALIRVLTTNEGKPHGSGVVIGRGGEGSPHATAAAVRISEAVPVDLCRSQSARQHAASPV